MTADTAPSTVEVMGSVSFSSHGISDASGVGGYTYLYRAS